MASLFLFAMVLQVSAPELFRNMLWPLLAALLCLALTAVFWMRTSNVHGQAAMQLNAHAFNIKHALIITVTISLVMLVSVFMRDWLGDNGAIAAAVFVGLAEIHAAAFSLSHLSLQPAISLPHLPRRCVRVRGPGSRERPCGSWRRLTPGVPGYTR